MRPKEVFVGASENLNDNPKIVIWEGVWGNKKILVKTELNFISKVLINEKITAQSICIICTNVPVQLVPTQMATS